MSKEPISLLGYFVQTMREKHGYRRRKLARMIGFSDGEVGAAAIRLLEELGQIDPPDLLDRLAVRLSMTEEELRYLQELDRDEAGNWLEQVRRPIKPHFGYKCGPMTNLLHVPEETACCSPIEIEEYARDFARSHRVPVRLHLYHRVCLVFDSTGELVEIQELGRNGWIQPELQSF
jgi:hypothetical protein